jgi:transposase InsO family protein
MPNDITLNFSRSGKPTDNGFIEAFNGRFRAERLTAHWFMTLPDAREKLPLGDCFAIACRPTGPFPVRPGRAFKPDANRCLGRSDLAWLLLGASGPHRTFVPTAANGGSMPILKDAATRLLREGIV